MYLKECDSRAGSATDICIYIYYILYEHVTNISICCQSNCEVHMHDVILWDCEMTRYNVVVFDFSKNNTMIWFVRMNMYTKFEKQYFDNFSIS